VSYFTYLLLLIFLFKYITKYTNEANEANVAVPTNISKKEKLTGERPSIDIKSINIHLKQYQINSKNVIYYSLNMFLIISFIPINALINAIFTVKFVLIYDIICLNIFLFGLINEGERLFLNIVPKPIVII